jgi:Uma2 family endonuclease
MKRFGACGARGPWDNTRKEMSMHAGNAITWEEFLAAGEEGQRWEWVDGEVNFMSPVNLRHERFLVRLLGWLDRFCQLHPEWTPFASNAIFTMAVGNWRMPDASLLRPARMPEPIPTKADFAPDVAFEILPPTDSPSQIQRKRQDYQQSGVIQVWFDLEKRLVKLIYPDRPLQFYRHDQTMTIDAVAGFALDLKDLFSGQN